MSLDRSMNQKLDKCKLVINKFLADAIIVVQIQLLKQTAKFSKFGRQCFLNSSATVQLYGEE